MKKITVTIDDEIDFKFRMLASQKYKFEKGWYSNFINEAIELWLTFNKIFNCHNKKFTPIWMFY